MTMIIHNLHLLKQILVSTDLKDDYEEDKTWLWKYA